MVTQETEIVGISHVPLLRNGVHSRFVLGLETFAIFEELFPRVYSLYLSASASKVGHPDQSFRGGSQALQMAFVVGVAPTEVLLFGNAVAAHSEFDSPIFMLDNTDANISM